MFSCVTIKWTKFGFVGSGCAVEDGGVMQIAGTHFWSCPSKIRCEAFGKNGGLTVCSSDGKHHHRGN